MLKSLLLILVTVLAAPAQDRAPLPKLWSVHVDQVIPDSVRRFEELGAAQSEARSRVLRDAGLSLAPSYEMATADGLYITLRPRESYAELERKFPDSVIAVLRTAVNPYSDTVHMFLERHHSELWTLDLEQTFISPAFDPHHVTQIQILSEDIRPPLNGVYDSLVAEFRELVQQAEDPVALLVFYSAYGTGRCRQFRLSSLPARGAVSVFDEGDRFREKWKHCTVSSEVINAVARPDLTDLPPGEPWLGIR